MGMDANGCEWVGMDANGCEWMGMDPNGREWIRMAGNGCECPNSFFSLDLHSMMLRLLFLRGID